MSSHTNPALPTPLTFGPAPLPTRGSTSSATEPARAPSTPARTPVFVFNSHLEAEAAIRTLQRSSFDVHKLSLIGKGYHSEEHPVGFYTKGDRIRAWGGMGAFWGGIWGLLVGPAVFMLPGLGVVALAGPLAAALVAALEGAVVVGSVSALSAALTSSGMTQEQAIRYESELKADRYILMVHGSADDITLAHTILAGMRAWKQAGAT